MANFITQSGAGAITVQGDWVLANAVAIERARQAMPHDSGTTINAQLQTLDTAGVELLHDFAVQLGMSLKHFEGLTPQQQALCQLVEEGGAVAAPAPLARRAPVADLLIKTGKGVYASWDGMLDLLRFLGQMTVTLGAVITNPRRLRVSSIMRHIYEAGIMAIPIVSLIAFLITIVLAYQGYNQLQRFGANVFTINLVAISVLREMGVLLTAVMIAGRSGSAFTAEIGVMKINEEVDAMKIIGVDPFDFLVLPRLLALIIVMPLLTFVADVMGMIGGGIVAYQLLGIGPHAYLERFHAAIKHWDVWIGVIKAPVFGFVIAMVACMRGLQVTGSAESVGKLTTTSVVQSIFLVLLLDAAFSILFTKLGM